MKGKPSKEKTKKNNCKKLIYVGVLVERDDYIVQLRQYIDRVLLKVIEKSPEILEDLGV